MEKKILIIGSILFMIGGFYLYKIETTNMLKFVAIDTATNQPIRKGTAHFKATLGHSPPKILKTATASIDENGHFEISENNFEYGIDAARIKFSISDEAGNFDDQKMTSVFIYRKNIRKLEVANYAHGFHHIIGRDEYDLKSNRVTHYDFTNYEDTTASFFDRIKVYQNSIKHQHTQTKIVYDILKKDSSAVNLIEQLWTIANKEVAEAHEIFIEKLFYSRWRDFVNEARKSRNDSPGEPYMELAKTTKDSNKKYYLYWAALKTINTQGNSYITLDAKKINRTIKEVSDFLKNNKKLAAIKHKRIRGKDYCGKLQRELGEVKFRVALIGTRKLPQTHNKACCENAKLE